MSKALLLAGFDANGKAMVEALVAGSPLKTVVAASAEEAVALVKSGGVDAVVAAMHGALGSGITLTAQLKAARKIPVVLVTRSSDLNETIQAYEAGVDGFVAEPCGREEILSVLSVCLGESLIEDSRSGDADFCSVAIGDFLAGREINYDVYIRLAGNRFVKIAHKGEDLSHDRIESYKARDATHLYIRKDEFKNYVAQTTEKAAMVATDPAEPQDKRVVLLRRTGEALMQEIFNEHLSEASFNYARVFIESAVTAISQNTDAMMLLTLLDSHADYLYAHSVGVSLYGVLLARQVRWTSQPNLFKIAMGGLLHDIGLKEIDRSILMKPRSELTAEEARLLDSHPLRGRDILGMLPTIPTDVVQIALQHHEDCSGLGFPFGLKRDRIHPLARLIRVADVFCELVMTSPSNPDGMAPLEAVERIQALHTGSLDAVFIDALCQLFKVEPARKTNLAA